MGRERKFRAWVEFFSLGYPNVKKLYRKKCVLFFSIFSWLLPEGKIKNVLPQCWAKQYK